MNQMLEQTMKVNQMKQELKVMRKMVLNRKMMQKLPVQMVKLMQKVVLKHLALMEERQILVLQILNKNNQYHKALQVPFMVMINL